MSCDLGQVDCIFAIEIYKKEVSMFTGALIVFSLLVIFIAACLLPWWFIPACIIATIINIFFFPHKY